MQQLQRQQDDLERDSQDEALQRALMESVTSPSSPSSNAAAPLALLAHSPNAPPPAGALDGDTRLSYASEQGSLNQQHHDLQNDQQRGTNGQQMVMVTAPPGSTPGAVLSIKHAGRSFLVRIPPGDPAWP